jgi:hypothetical protein
VVLALVIDRSLFSPWLTKRYHSFTVQDSERLFTVNRRVLEESTCRRSRSGSSPVLGRERAQTLKAQADAYRELSSSLAHDTPAPEYA